MRDVMFYEVFGEERDALRRFMPKTIDAQFSELTPQERGDKKLPSPLICLRTQSRLPLSWGAGISGILTRSTGYDHLLRYRTLTKRYFPCGYLPDYCARAVAEHALMIMMALWRKIPLQVKSFKTFERTGLTGRECLDKHLLVVGVGRIGGEIVRMASALGMKTRGVDIAPGKKDVEYVGLQEGIRWADAVISAVPLTEHTRGMLDYRFFKKARTGCVFVNISRGEVSPLRDLKRLLDEGRLAALGMDVFEEEQMLAAALRGKISRGAKKASLVREMLRRENVLFTPHNAFNTREALERKAEQTAESIKIFLREGRFPEPVPEK